VFDLPEEKENKTELNICEKVRLAADEYLRLELPEPETAEIAGHTAICKDCFEYIENEKKYLEEIKLAEYIPEIPVSQSVMDKIIDNIMVVDKAPRRRFIPVGFISAAAIVIMIAAVSQTGLFDLISSPVTVSPASPASPAADNYGTPEAFDGGFELWAAPADTETARAGGMASEEAEEAFDDGNFALPARRMAFDLDIESEPEAGDIGEATGIVWDTPDIWGAALPAPTGVFEPYAAEAPRVEQMAEYIALNSGLEINQFYEFYFVAGDERELNSMNAMRNIQISAADESSRGMFNIIEKGYKLILNENLTENNISVSEIFSIYEDGEYIAVIYWFN
jgi:hypothetical protein